MGNYNNFEAVERHRKILDSMGIYDRMKGSTVAKEVVEKILQNLESGTAELMMGIVNTQKEKAQQSLADMEKRLERQERGLEAAEKQQRTIGNVGLQDEKAVQALALYAGVLETAQRFGVDMDKASREAGYISFAWLDGTAEPPETKEYE